MSFIFGIDVGGTTVKIGLFNTDAMLLDNWEVPTRKEENGKYILSDVADSIKAKMLEKDIDIKQVVGAGVGVPGPVKTDGSVSECVNLGWGKVQVSETLSAMLDMPVKTANDANVAALGEMWNGGAKGYNNVVLVTLGTGVGGGIIIDGKIVAGSHGASGEIGHITLNPHETVACNCTKKGCVEQYASATGIVNEAKKALNVSSETTVLRDIEDLTAKDIFDAAKAGDEFAKGQVERLGYHLGLALGTICAVADPEVIVIGGGVSKAGAIIPDTIKKYFVQYAFNACRDTDIVLAKLGNDAGIYGSAKLILG